MLLVEIKQETMSTLRDRTRLRGGLAKVARESKIHTTTISRIIEKGTADEGTAAKLENYLNPKATVHATSPTHSA